MKKFYGLLIWMLLFLICTAAFAAGTVIPDQSGKCWDDQCWWELDNGVLTIRATGDPNASSSGWDAGSVKKVVIEDGVTRIPKPCVQQAYRNNRNHHSRICNRYRDQRVLLLYGNQRDSYPGRRQDNL